MKTYGYARKKYPKELAKQLESIIPYNCEEIYVEEYLFRENSELKLLMKKIKSGDRLIVDSLQCFGKGYKELRYFFQELQEKDVHIISIGDAFDSEETTNVYHIVSQLFNAGFLSEKEKKQQRLVISRKNGTILGRPTIDQPIVEKVQYLYFQKKISMREIASKCEISLGSVHKYIQKEKQVET